MMSPGESDQQGHHGRAGKRAWAQDTGSSSYEDGGWGEGRPGGDEEGDRSSIIKISSSPPLSEGALRLV